MPTPTYASVAEVVTTILQSNGDVNQNVLHFLADVSTSFTDAQLDALMDKVNTEYTTTLRGVTTNKDSLVKILAKDMSSAPYHERVETLTSTGTNSTSELPKQLAACVSLHTGTAGRSGRGRVFIGSMTSDALTSAGALTTTYRGAIHDYVAALATPFSIPGGDTAQLAVLSRKLLAAFPVVTVTTDTRADVQRRRANRRLP